MSSRYANSDDREREARGSFISRPQGKQVEETLLNFLQLGIEAEVRRANFRVEDAILVAELRIFSNLNVRDTWVRRKILLPALALPRTHAYGHARPFAH